MCTATWSKAFSHDPKEIWQAEKVSIWQAGMHDKPLGQRLTALMISKRLADSAVAMPLLASHLRLVNKDRSVGGAAKGGSTDGE
jgi:hypothetical protein